MLYPPSCDLITRLRSSFRNKRPIIDHFERSIAASITFQIPREPANTLNPRCISMIGISLAMPFRGAEIAVDAELAADVPAPGGELRIKVSSSGEARSIVALELTQPSIYSHRRLRSHNAELLRFSNTGVLCSMTDVYFLDRPLSHFGTLLRLPPLSLLFDCGAATGAGALSTAPSSSWGASGSSTFLA